MKHAEDIVKEMDERGGIEIPEGCFASDSYDEYIQGETMKGILEYLVKDIPTWKVILIDKLTDFKVWLWCKIHKNVK